MLRKKTIIIGLLIGAFVITGSLVVLAQVAGDDVGRNILRMARQRNTGETVQETAEPEKSTAQTPAASVATPAAVTRRPAITVTDAVLSLLPADCLLCVRINTLDTSLGAFDQYITGVSPIPVSLALLAKGQLGELLSDPMLSGVNTQGDFVIFATPLPVRRQAHRRRPPYRRSASACWFRSPDRNSSSVIPTANCRAANTHWSRWSPKWRNL